MRIALTYPEVSLTGGVERVLVHTANELARRGNDVHVLASDVVPGLLDPAVTVVPVPIRRLPDPGWAIAYRHQATRVLAARGPFDVHGSLSALSPLGGVYWTPSVHRAAYLEALHRRSGAGALAVRINPYHLARLRMERQTLSRGGYARVLVQAPNVAREVVELYGVPEDDVGIVPLGVDVDAFSAQRRLAQRAEARAAHGFGEGEQVVAFVANELERKGYDTLLSAVERMDGARILVVGRMRPPEHERVVWAGLSSDVPLQLAAADAFALPTRYEPWGLVIVEALAAGLPVVTSRLAGAAEVIEEGRTGALLDDPQDAAALAGALRWALECPTSAQDIAASVAHLSWPAVIARYEDELRAVAARTGGAALG